jgi:UDP-N-acetylmuramoyl-tripeptide--D-alanyl-D-alanine ligase
MEGNRARLYRVGPWLVMDDSYNSNPDSLRAALGWLPEAPVSGRRHLVLGDMLELGEAAPEIHRGMGGEAAESGADSLFAFGPLAGDFVDGAREAGLDSSRAFEDHQALAEALLEQLLPGDLVLVKGSRGMTMEKVIERLERAGGPKEEWR